MAPHRSRKLKRKSHKRKEHKHKKRSRQHLRKHDVRRESEGTIRPYYQDTSTREPDTRDMRSFIGNRKEMVKQLFSSVDDDFLSRHLPMIFKGTAREELKRMCFEELSTMSADIVHKVLEGIQCGTRPHSSPEDWPSRKITEPVSSRFSGATPKPVSEEICSQIRKKKEEVMELEHKRTEVGVTFARDELPSTSYQASKTKKLAKVAPFIIKAPKVENNPPEMSWNESVNVSDMDSDSEGDSEEEDVGNQSHDSESLTEDSTSEAERAEIAECESRGVKRVSEEEMHRKMMEHRLADLEELEHRARAIKSMLAHMDRTEAARADKSSGSSGSVRFRNFD